MLVKNVACDHGATVGDLCGWLVMHVTACSSVEYAAGTIDGVGRRMPASYLLPPHRYGCRRLTSRRISRGTSRIHEAGNPKGKKNVP
jgi:hypothetical protein